MAELDGQRTQIEIALEQDGKGVAVLRVSGQLDISNAVELEQALALAAAASPRVVVFELSGLEFMDSAGISVLVRARSEAGEVRLRNPSAIVRRLIEITGLEGILQIEP